MKRAVAPVIPWLRGRTAQDGRKLAAVLDIDNTALETHHHPGRANKPVLEVARWAAGHDVAVLFVTARTSSSSVRGRLRDAGYAVDAVCTRKHGEGKKRCRVGLTRSGYTITANIGNNPSDFEGGSCERGFLLPSHGGALS
ncbi:HAD family acid phosphatase [Streptomyces sp. NPDC059176]|uniref:HAD family acid phosphatase n=1 Tax=Streptomyces sp. NPDC059176 TaxID=3346758 RepID=UPI0036AF8FC5